MKRGDFLTYRGLHRLLMDATDCTSTVTVIYLERWFISEIRDQSAKSAINKRPFRLQAKWSLFYNTPTKNSWQGLHITNIGSIHLFKKGVFTVFGYCAPKRFKIN